MSNEINTILLDEARDLAEECTNSSLGDQLLVAVKSGDLDRIRELSSRARNHLNTVDRWSEVDN